MSEKESSSASNLAFYAENLSDEAKIEKFMEAFEMNHGFFEGKIVLNVGCGHGLLSMLAAKAYAATIIGVDTRPDLDITEEVIKENKMTGKIHIIRSKVEDLVLPDGITQVDVIVSDWFGKCLLHKSSLKDVIIARDKFLKPGGLMFPDTASLYITGVDDHLQQDTALSYWDHIYGFDMSAIAKLVKQEPQHVKFSPNQVMTNSHLMMELDLHSPATTKENVEFLSPFQLNVLKKGYIRGLALHVSFGFNYGVKSVQFSTAVNAGNDWKQIYLHLQDYLVCNKEDQLCGRFYLKSSENKLEIDFDLELKGEHSRVTENNKFEMV